MGVKAAAGYWHRLDGVEKVFLAFLLFAQAYYSYRYAFRIQSDLAPPGYEATPEAYQYPKYVIAAAALGLLALLFVRNQESLTHLLKRLRQEPVWLLLIAFSLYCGLSAFRFGVEPGQLSHIAKFVFVVPFAMAAALIWRQKSPADFVVLFLGASLAYHVLYELVMFINFEATGRWPALTFSQLVPRYGAGWDDPNGFGAFAILALIGVLFLKTSPGSAWRGAHLALVFLLMLMAALTYSATAAVGLAIGCGLLLVARRIDVAKVAAMAGACLVVGAGLLVSGHIDIIVEGKLKSIQAHTRTKTSEPTPTAVPTVVRAPTSVPSAGPTVVPVPGVQQPPGTQSPAGTQQPASPPSGTAAAPTGTTSDGRTPGENVLRALVGPSDHVHFHETMYLLIYLNFGLLGVGLFIAVQALTLYRAVLQWRSGAGEAYLLGAILLAVFLAMNSFLPLYAIFPVNLYMWVIVGMVWARPLLAPVGKGRPMLAPSRQRRTPPSLRADDRGDLVDELLSKVAH